MQGFQNNLGTLSPEILRSISLPGVIGGYGGGTWNADGSVATLPSAGSGFPTSEPSPPARTGMFGRLGSSQSVPPQANPLASDSGGAVAPAAEPRLSWMEGGKLTWKDGLAFTLGTIGDALQQAGGGQATFLPFVAANRKRHQELADSVARRRAEREEWLWRQQWERNNPPARAPHYWETNNGSLGVVGADGKPSILYQDPTPKVDWVRADNGDGTFTLTPVPQGGAQPSQAPTPSKQALKTPKPAGMTDADIWAQAHEAVRNGADVNEVFRRLQSWGMNP